MTALQTASQSTTNNNNNTVDSRDVELTQSGYSIGIATFFENGNHVGPQGIDTDTLDVIDALLEEGDTHGTTDGIDWKVL